MRFCGCLCTLTALCWLGVIAGRSEAQVVVVGSPVLPAPVVATPVYTAPVMTAPVVVGPSYSVGYGSYPASVSHYSASYGSVMPSAYTTSGYVPGTYVPSYRAYSPVVASTVIAPTTYVAPAAVMAYRPIVPAVPYATYAVPYAAARPVVVSPKVYVPGEPVRNVIRAVTP